MSTQTHTQTLTELEASKKASAQLKEQLNQAATQRKAAERLTAGLAKEREALVTRSSELQSRLDGLEKEKGQLNSELSNAQSDAARIAKEREHMRQEQARLAATLDQERAAKEEEITRLTRTQEELSKSLQDEIAKGNITIQQVRDRVLFDSGQAQVKPAGVKVLKQVSDILKTVTDKQIRIEGHTDNVPISSKLQDRFKTNWELSTARATTVVHYLIDQGSVDRQHLSAVGYADTQPLSSNDSEEGRSSNRRIEIVLYPKDLKEIAGQVKTSAASSK
ncbi:MAG: OmpA family protein [Nitrospiraceae bacterium]